MKCRKECGTECGTEKDVREKCGTGSSSAGEVRDRGSSPVQKAADPRWCSTSRASSVRGWLTVLSHTELWQSHAFHCGHMALRANKVYERLPFVFISTAIQFFTVRLSQTQKFCRTAL